MQHLNGIIFSFIKRKSRTAVTVRDELKKRMEEIRGWQR